MSRPLRVELVSHASRRSGGAVLSLVELALGLAARSDMDVTVTLPESGPLEERLPPTEVKVRHQRHLRWVVPPGRRLKELRAAPRRLRAARRWLRVSRPDVVLTNTVVAPGPALAAKAVGIPHVWRIGELTRREHPLPFAVPPEAVLRTIGRLSRAVVVPSEVVAEELSRYVAPTRLHVIPAPVDIHGDRPPSGTAHPIKRLIMIGPLVPVKRGDDALVALALLVGRGYDLRLSVLGPQGRAAEEAFRDTAHRVGVSQRIDVRGELPNPWEEIGDDAILLSCSGEEALARATIEAMEHSVPVVAAAGGANAKHVRDGETGLLYAVGDPAALADRVARACDDPEGRDRMVRAAYEWASTRFTREGYAASYAEILHRLSLDTQEPR